MSRWDSATPEDDCMFGSSDDVPEPMGASAAGAAFWEGRYNTTRQTPSPIVPKDQVRGCGGAARGSEVVWIPIYDIEVGAIPS